MEGGLGSAGGCRGAPRWPLAHTASPSPPQHLPSGRWRFMGFICCCQLPLICEQAGISLGERVGRGQRDGCLRGRFCTSPCSEGLNVWSAAGVVEFLPRLVSWGKKNCKLMTALKQALVEFWGCQDCFNYLQVEILGKGRVWGRSSWSLWWAVIEVLWEGSSLS